MIYPNPNIQQVLSPLSITSGTQQITAMTSSVVFHVRQRNETPSPNSTRIIWTLHQGLAGGTVSPNTVQPWAKSYAFEFAVFSWILLLAQRCRWQERLANARAHSCCGRWIVTMGLSSTGCMLMSSWGRSIACDLSESRQGRSPPLF